MTDSAVLRRLNVSRETIDRLKTIEALLAKWNPAINLVSKASLPNAWARHILDSAQIYELAPPNVDHWADLGSGGGFPGLIIATIAAELDASRRITLVESDQRKATFLRQAAQSVGLSVSVLAERIEILPPLNANVLSARALASLPDLCSYASRHLAQDGLALFPKGATYREEVAQAGRSWRYDLTVHPSETDSSAVILALKAIEHV
jgi:16S rRNA (guanine527-N7)-methyltransferase